ncbi:hypothetical protein PIB30_105429, partial [Stylosanthes scabra]|nr:hypothetical protein [Stylosanthes scabra]
MGEITQGERILEALSNKEQEEEAQAQIEIWKYIFGYVELAVIKCAIELGIADAIESHGSPMTLSQLSSALASDASLLNRILRFLSNRKIFKAVKKDSDSDSNTTYYANTALSRRLVKRGQQSMASFLLLESSPVMLAPWHSLSARVSVNNGGIANFPFEKAHGEDVWCFAAENPGHSNLINEAMACSAKIVVPAIVEGCGGEVFGDVKTVVDVGGGNGTAMRVLVKACPWIRGINFDLAHVIAVAPESEGVQNVAGDMFLGVPKADAAFIM